MIAITRSACRTPSSISFASSVASATEWMGTLRTSMASGMGPLSPTPRPASQRGWSVGDDDGASVAVHGGAQVGEVGDDAAGPAALAEPAHGLPLRSHRATGEVPLGGVGPQLSDTHGAEVRGLRSAVVQHRVRYVGRDDEDVGPDRPGQQRRAEVLVDHRLDAAQVAVAVTDDRDSASAVG